MNGSLHSSPNYEDIKLKRGPTGFGFNIVGGKDQLFFLNDGGILVTKIKEDGVAALDGRLKEGDQILSINGIPLKDMEHSAAVKLFMTAGEEVELRVKKKTRQPDPRPEQHSNPSISYLNMLALFAGAIAILAIMYKQRK